MKYKLRKLLNIAINNIEYSYQIPILFVLYYIYQFKHEKKINLFVNLLYHYRIILQIQYTFILIRYCIKKGKNNMRKR